MTEEQLAVPRRVGAELDRLGIGRGELTGVALSGGADSVALILSLREAGLTCVGLHCNFGLRGPESDGDEMYVRGLCDSIGVPLECVRFDVASRRALTGESVEMACRELRYEWFADRAAALGLSYVAVGHHLEDDVETFFLNLLRGSGLPGLSGMAARRGIYIRPLLRCTRTEIEAYLNGKNVDFVTDSSNLSDDYGRNRLRHHVLPAFEMTAHDALKRVGRSMRYLRDDRDLLEGLLAQKRDALVDSDGVVDMAALLSEPSPAHLLFRMLLPIHPGFDARQAEAAVAAAARGESGKIFDVGDSRMLLDRGRLLPYCKTEQDPPQEVDFTASAGILAWLTAKIIDAKDFRPVRDAWKMWVDAGILREGLRFIVRAPRRGDRMAPYGMRGTRLLSDLFRDAALSEADKERVKVLSAIDPCTGAETILWVPGIRASRHYPVTAGSPGVLELTALRF